MSCEYHVMLGEKKKDLYVNPVLWRMRYHNDPKFSDRYAWANSADPDQTAPRGAV